jgi:hypothetical protein
MWNWKYGVQRLSTELNEKSGHSIPRDLRMDLRGVLPGIMICRDDQFTVDGSGEAHGCEGRSKSVPGGGEKVYHLDVRVALLSGWCP